jgi:hypothetical protein
MLWLGVRPTWALFCSLSDPLHSKARRWRWLDGPSRQWRVALNVSQDRFHRCLKVMVAVTVQLFAPLQCCTEEQRRGGMW